MSGPLLLPTWEQLEATHPQVVATMRAYLGHVACVLRPGSVKGADLALRSFTAYLAAEHPAVQRIREVGRPQVEGFKTWVAARPGQNKARVAPAAIAHRLGTLRVFFLRIDEWGWDEAPPRVPMFLGDAPRQEHALSKALDDATAAKLLRAAQTGKRMLVGVTVEFLLRAAQTDKRMLVGVTVDFLLRAAQTDKRMLVGVTVDFLLRTGLRVGEYTALASDAVVLIGDTRWLHVPVGKLHEDRYLPLHPRIVEVVDTYRSTHVPPGHPLLLPRENGKALDRHTLTRFINKAGAAAGLAHIHPHQLRHTLATQAINRGMSIEAIAAMLGHKSLDMTLVYAKIANRTVAQEYFTVAEKVDALYCHPPQLPADALGPNMARLNREHHRMLGNGYCARPKAMDCQFENICESCTFFQTTIAFRPTLLAQRDDACAKGQTRRAEIFEELITGLDTTEAS